MVGFLSTKLLEQPIRPPHIPNGNLIHARGLENFRCNTEIPGMEAKGSI